MTDVQILKRLYKDYTKKYVNKILLSVFFTVLLAGSTSAVAYLLDPAIEKLAQVTLSALPAFMHMRNYLPVHTLYA